MHNRLRFMSLIQSRSVTNVDHCAPRGSSRSGDRFPYVHLSNSGFAISEPSAGRLELHYRSPHLPRPLKSRPFPRRNVPHDMKPPGVTFPSAPIIKIVRQDRIVPGGAQAMACSQNGTDIFHVEIPNGQQEKPFVVSQSSEAWGLDQ